MYSIRENFSEYNKTTKATAISLNGTLPFGYQAVVPDPLDSDFGFGSTYYFRIYTYAPGNAQHPRFFQSPYTYLQKFATNRVTRNYHPRINYWRGKVNQHIDSQGNWVTDPDGVSGADIDKLEYCRKWYPDTYGVTDYMNETIVDWKAAGNTGSYAGTFMSAICITPQVLKPDLTVDEIRFVEQYATQANTLVAHVCNHGSSGAVTVSQYSVEFTLGGVTRNTIVPGQMQSGECKEVLSPINQFLGSGWTPGTYTVTAAADFDSSGVLYNVVDESNEQNNSLTKNIYINNISVPVNPEIMITSPQAGDRLIHGNTYSITWNQQFINNISIYLGWGQGFTSLLASNLDVDENSPKGSYMWSIPPTMWPGEYKIDIIGFSRGFGQVYASSALFYIDNQTQPDLIVDNFTYHVGTSDPSVSDLQVEFDVINGGEIYPEKGFKYQIKNDEIDYIIKEEALDATLFPPKGRIHVIILGKVGFGFSLGYNTISVNIDSDNEINEFDESNNYFQTLVVISDKDIMKPDLFVGHSPSVRRIDDQTDWDLVVVFGVMNSGSVTPQSDFKLRVENLTNGAIIHNETFIGSQFTPDHYDYLNILGRIGQEFIYGNNTLEVTIDIDNVVDEVYEDNNVTTSEIQVDHIEPLPDFIVNDVQIRKDQADDKSYIYTTIMNIGGRALPPGQTLPIQIVDLDSGDKYLTGIADDFINGYIKEVVAGTPLILKEGLVYHLRAFVDYASFIQESNEINNIFESEIKIAPPEPLPDFVVTDLQIRKDPVDDKRYVYTTIKNIGGRVLPPNQILSLRMTDLDTGDVYLGGVTDDFVTGYTKEVVSGIPLKKKKNDYYRLHAEVDSGHSIPESNEENNARDETIKKNGKEHSGDDDNNDDDEKDKKDEMIGKLINKLEELREEKDYKRGRKEWMEISNKLRRIFMALPDADHDLLPDEWEGEFGTDPHNYDTDGDLLPDGAEVLAGKNPVGK